MSAATNVRRYPWHALHTVDRRACRVSENARHLIESRLDYEQLSLALAELTKLPVDCFLKEVRPRPRLSVPNAAVLAAALLDCGIKVVLRTEPALVLEVLQRVLSQPQSIPSHPIDVSPAMLGAAAAVLVETCRRARAKTPVVVLEDVPTPGDSEEEVAYDFSLILGERSFWLSVHLFVNLASMPPSPSAPKLLSLGELPISLPVILGQTRCRRPDLDAFQAGDVLLPETGWFSQSPGRGRAVLAAGTGERGLGVELCDQGRIVVGGGLIMVEIDDEAEVLSETAEDVVLEAPVLVRIEVGSVTLTARQWAQLRPGDVIESSQRINHPVTLRVAGREVAEGELVSVEGHVGVRLRRLLTGENLAASE